MKQAKTPAPDQDARGSEDAVPGVPSVRGLPAEVAPAEQPPLDAGCLAAIAEKIAAARTTQYFRTRAARADPQAFLAVLERIKQVGGPVVQGDDR